MARFLALLLLTGCASVPTSFVVTTSGSGKPVVLLPDLAMPREAWDTTVEHLKGRYQVHVVEVAGFAGRAPVAGPLMPLLRTELATYLKEHHLEGAVLVGLMFGASVAWWLAESEPALIGGVFSIDTPPSRFNGEIDPEAAEGRDALSHAPPERFAKMMRSRFSRLMNDQTIAARLADQAVRSTPAVMADGFYDSMTRDLRDVSSIRAPVMCLLTTESVPPEVREPQQELFRAQLSQIAKHELVVVPGAHHYVMFDDPTVYFSALDKFLAETR
ncbi:MAG: alpha/beta hydrolase [Archangium sp.]